LWEGIKLMTITVGLDTVVANRHADLVFTPPLVHSS
jgi:hypothetical protein